MEDGKEIQCPFCKGKAIVFDDEEILCGNPGCEAYPRIVRQEK